MNIITPQFAVSMFDKIGLGISLLIAATVLYFLFMKNGNSE